ncbi:MAG: TetR/AcrR family transcriptional regulator [Spirochaetes bacterium]|nr:TetR/AcrR family transcriptional regulator [Spirochaetota bacterium]
MKSVKENKKSGRQSNEEAEKTKIKILDSALKIFAQNGFYNTSLRDIAAHAGTTHNLIRHHFGSKDDLWKAAVDNKIQSHADSLTEILEDAGLMDPVDLLKLFIKTFISYTARNTELAKIFFSDYGRNNPHLDYLLKKQKVFLDITQPIFTKVQKKGYFRDINHESFAIYLTSLVETPIVTSVFTNKIMKVDISSEKGIAIHTKNVLRFLFGNEN